MQHETLGPLPRVSADRTSERAILELLKQALRQIEDLTHVDRTACASFIAQALRIHQASSWPAPPPRHQTGLATWQVRVVNDMALANLDAPLAISDLAEACNLSRGYFTRAFTATFGESPHRWRIGKRVEHACHKLVHSLETIADIAVACGFSDQAHFTRVFKGARGVTPNVYRRRRYTTKIQSRADESG